MNAFGFVLLLHTMQNALLFFAANYCRQTIAQGRYMSSTALAERSDLFLAERIKVTTGSGIVQALTRKLDIHYKKILKRKTPDDVEEYMGSRPRAPI